MKANRVEKKMTGKPRLCYTSSEGIRSRIREISDEVER